jgi:hypothetical protein
MKMREFNLWDLITMFGDDKERKLFLSCSDSVYEQLDDKVLDLSSDIRDFIEERIEEIKSDLLEKEVNKND